MHRVVRRRGGRRVRGQTLVEFAFVLPIFLFMLFGLIDLGRYVYMHSTLSQAAREAARVASVEAYWVGSADPSCNQPGGPVCPATVAALRADALTAANRMLTPFGPITAAQLFLRCDASSPPTGGWTDQTCSSRASGSLASVRVTLSITPITPLIDRLFPSMTSTAAATMVVD